MSPSEKVTLAGAAGAWGDSSLSTPQLISDGRADYIVYEGLAEITMAILSRARSADPSMGYARDIIETITANVAAFRKAGMRVITNAGGVNPESAADLIKSVAPDVRVATVTGDDLMGGDGLSGVELSGEPLAANVYLGAFPIAAALEAGAEIVVTGRVVDSALTLGPLIHEFGWSRTDFDRLSAGSLAGHLIECGPQATGGLMTDWDETNSWVNPGYPLAVVGEDGCVVITAAKGSDAVVTRETVAEQILYEIGDPSRYLLPDVACDWLGVSVEQVGDTEVAVAGARGVAPPVQLKGCAQIPDGWRAQSLVFIGGRDAVAKARRAGNDLIDRGRRMLSDAGMADFRATDIEVLGAEDTYGANARAGETREVVLKIAVHHDDRNAVERFVREVPSIGLAGPPGVSGGGSGLPRATPLIRLECFGVDRDRVRPEVHLNGETVEFTEFAPAESIRSPNFVMGVEGYDGPTVAVPLVAIAHGRSGDKGADLNIGIRARHPDFYLVLRRELTEDRVAEYLSHLGATSVRRYELPGIHAVNFLLTGGLGAGGTASLRFDPQGKAVAQQLLDIEVALPTDLAGHPALRPV